MSRPQIIARLAELYREHGLLTPDLVVADARAKSSPLHSFFEWDNKAAAEGYRRDQARRLIASVRVEITTETRTISAVGYVRHPDAESDMQGYVSTPDLQTDADMARRALRQELKRLDALLDRVQSLADAVGLQSEVRMMQEQATRIRARLDSSGAPSAGAALTF